MLFDRSASMVPTAWKLVKSRSSFGPGLGTDGETDDVHEVMQICFGKFHSSRIQPCHAVLLWLSIAFPTKARQSCTAAASDCDDSDQEGLLILCPLRNLAHWYNVLHLLVKAGEVTRWRVGEIGKARGAVLSWRDHWTRKVWQAAAISSRRPRQRSKLPLRRCRVDGSG